MALKPIFTAAQRCKDKVIMFSDSTEYYNATYSPSGYDEETSGSVVNLKRSAVTSTSFELKTPSSSYYKRVGWDEGLELYSLPYLPTTKDDKISLEPKKFLTYDREPDPATITGKNGETITVYSKLGTEGDVKFTLEHGSETAAGSISSTSLSDATISIQNGTTTLAQIKTLLLTHDAVNTVITAGSVSTYTFGERIIENKNGSDRISSSGESTGQLSNFTTGCYELRYRVWQGSIDAGTSITDGTLYIVHGADADEFVTYDETKYYNGDIFRANSESAFTRNAASVKLGSVVGEKIEKFIYWCNLHDYVKDIILKSSSVKCEKDCDFVESLSLMGSEMSSIFVAFEEDHDHCACENIKDLEDLALNFINRCC